MINYQVKQLEHFLWTEKYRPTEIINCILPVSIKTIFQQFVDNGDFPHLLLSGSAGCGKTTVAKALADQLDMDTLFINASEDGGIDNLRNRIRDFCSSVSLSANRKCVILDEADNATLAFFSGFRSFLEEFSKNVRFILTCNYLNKIIEPIHSRCSVIEFKISKSDKTELMSQFLKRIKFILKKEEIAIDNTGYSAIADLVMKYFPDYRRMINELQQYSSTGKIDAGLSNGNTSNNEFKELIDHIKSAKYQKIQEWCSRYCQGQSLDLYRKFYDTSKDIFVSDSIPLLILLIAKYQYQAAFVMDGEINFAAFCIECKTDLVFK